MFAIQVHDRRADKSVSTDNSLWSTRQSSVEPQSKVLTRRLMKFKSTLLLESTAGTSLDNSNLENASLNVERDEGSTN